MVPIAIFESAAVTLGGFTRTPTECFRLKAHSTRKARTLVRTIRLWSNCENELLKPAKVCGKVTPSRRLDLEYSIPVSAPFDAIATTYDDTFSNSSIGRVQRSLVWLEAD